MVITFLGVLEATMKKTTTFVLVLGILAFATAGCTEVAPYERGKLAHWSMTTSDMAGPAEAHARAIHEGAMGGGFEAGGGCGCN